MRHILRSPHLFPGTTTRRLFSTAKKPNQEDLVQKLISRAEEYRHELRKHIIAAPTSRKIRKSLSVINQSIGTLEIRRKELESIFDMSSQKPDLVSLEILSNGTTHMAPCVVIRTPFNTYMFNCPEGTSRFLPTLRIRPQAIQDFFLTRGTWDCMGGLFGVLLAKESPDHITHVHGPHQLKFFLESVRPFADADFGNQAHPFQLEERSYDKGVFEDITLKAHYIPIYAMNSDPKVQLSDSMKRTDVAYLLELKEPNKRIDIFKLTQHKVPKGPLVGRLKNGQTISLDDGRVIRPEDVYAEDSKDCCPNLLIVECDCVEKLDSLKTNSTLEAYTTGQKKMGYVVHLTSNSVLKTHAYQKWMQTFGAACLHLIANGTGEALPLTDGIYRQQQMLNELCPVLFPPLYPWDFSGNVTQDVSPPPTSTNVVGVKNLGKYPMRTTTKAVRNEAIFLSLGDSELAERTSEYGSISEAVETFKLKLESLDTTANPYPLLAFLGTASAVSTKYRNVSGYWLQLRSDVSVLVDCGEGTYGQLKTLYGPEKTIDVLVGLSAMFITHAHLDHIAGINTIISRRVEAFQTKGIEYKPLVLVCNSNVRKLLTLYRTNFENLECYINLVDIGLYVKPTDFSLYSRDQLISKISLPDDLYSAERWNLKSIYAVQVHHTRMANGFVFDTLDGKRVVFSGDTKPCDILAEAGKDADLLIHEATFEDGFEDDADRKKHSTTGQALDIAKAMNAKLTILSHFSARYPRIPVISQQMLQMANVGVAFDNLVVPFNAHSIVPKLLPLFQKLFNRELDELSIKEMQRNLRVSLEEKPKRAKPSTERREPFKAPPKDPPPLNRSKSPVFKKPRHNSETGSVGSVSG